jgi:hypothetical protein
VEASQYASCRTLEQRHVSSGELGTRTKLVHVYAPLLQVLRHRRNRTEVSDDLNIVPCVDERHDLVAHDVVGQEHHVGLRFFPNIR